MIKFLVLLSLSAYCSAGSSYGAGSGMSMGSSSGYGSGGSGMNMGASSGYGSGGSAGGYGGSGGYSHDGGPIQAAVQTRHTVEVRPVPTQYTPIQPQVIEVDSGDLPIILNFNSRSSRILVQQSHTPAGPGEVQSTQSEDEPHRLVHEVLKPVIQEVREIITPYRRILQEIRPVVEEIHTVVAKGEQRRPNDNRDSYQSGGSTGMGAYGNGGGMGAYGNGGGMGGYGSGGGMSMTSMSGLMGSDGGYGGSKMNVINLGGSGYGSALSAGSSTSQSYKS